MRTQKDTVYEFDTLEFVNNLIEDYTDLMHKAMDNDDEQKVHKFDGSITALSILRDRLMKEA